MKPTVTIVKVVRKGLASDFASPFSGIYHVIYPFFTLFLLS